MSEEKITRERIISLLGAYPREQRYALAVMQDMQKLFGYVPREGLQALADALDCPLASLYSMATFYKALSLRPKGKHIIKVCDGTACHIRRSTNLIDGIRRELGIGPDETTGDGEFSLELVNCVGACALSPVMVIDGVYHGNVTVDSIPGILSEVREGAAP